ncbi:MAG: hypothetical protein MZV63_36100 [Marinilabiliales bacterium]|nr:hypothetical protein [Marinilabiliales bacterium]
MNLTAANLRVGFIGALNWQPNLDGLRWFLARSMAPCRQKHPLTPHCTLQAEALRQMQKQMAAGRNVFFEGEVDDARTFHGINDSV